MGNSTHVNTVLLITNARVRWRWQGPRFVAVKVGVSDTDDMEIKQRERNTLMHIKHANPRHHGHKIIRTLYDDFILDSETGEHVSLALEPLSEPIDHLRNSFVDKKFPVPLLSILAPYLLRGLDYLHSECSVIHTDLKADNILMCWPAPSAADGQFTRQPNEHEDPCLRKSCLIKSSIYLTTGLAYTSVAQGLQ